MPIRQASEGLIESEIRDGGTAWLVGRRVLSGIFGGFFACVGVGFGQVGGGKITNLINKLRKCSQITHPFRRNNDAA